MKKEYDFSKAKKATEIPHLNKLREDSQKTRITIYLDTDVINEFKAKSLETGTGYQTEINRVLRQYISGGIPTLTAIDEMVRKAIKEEIGQQNYKSC